MRNHTAQRFLLVILILFVLVASQWLFRPGFIPTHDGEYHIIRFYEFGTMLQSGSFFPRWAPNLNSGYGVPLFNFFYPLPNYIGSFFHHVGWSLSDSVKLTLATGYIAAIYFCYLWLSRLETVRAALVGTILFASVPYWFVELYVRGAVGEVLALAAFMGALVSIERRKWTGVALACGLVVLSHNSLSVVFFPILIGYALVRRAPLWPFLLGLGVSAYFWIPALVEQRYVMGLNTVSFKDYFVDIGQLLIPSWGTGFSGSGYAGNEMSYQIGIMPLLLFFLFPFYYFRQHNRQRRKIGALIFFVVILSIILMLPVSRWIWNTLPPMQYLQYPWRFLAVLLPCIAFIGSFIVSKIRSVWLLFLVVGSSIMATIFYTKPVVYPPRNDAYYLSRREFTDGTSSLGNSFSTLWSSWKRERPQRDIEALQGSIIVRASQGDPLARIYTIDVVQAARIRAAIAYYPGWIVLDNGVSQPIDYTSDGTIIFSLGKGIHRVRIEFSETPLRMFVDTISGLCFFWIVGSGILKLSYEYRYRHYTPVNGT